MKAVRAKTCFKWDREDSH